MSLRVFLLLLAFPPSAVFAQGQDSTAYERDLMVIAEMLPGIYANTNQVYFDGRLKRTVRHAPVNVTIEALANNANAFIATERWRRTEEDFTGQVLIQLSLDGSAEAVRMDVDRLDAAQRATVAEGGMVEIPIGGCGYHWRREAAQFRAAATADCGDDREVVLSATELWISDLAPADGEPSEVPYKLHRARPFECYVDIPGVGGGRDIPYRRYGPHPTHDQGGSFSFVTEEEQPRRLGVTLHLVDWPLNNYEGVFTRNSLVIYVNEVKPDGKRIEHGYSFTTPIADRVGINLKWALAYCYTESNESARPSM